MRRVAVTGVGAVSPLGLDAPSTWRTAVGGESGIDWIKAFDASDYPVRIAGEVKGFDPTQIASPKEARKLERNVLFALSAAREALGDAGLNGFDPNRVGMVGLSYGGYYALVTPALDTRIKVSVSSCYYGVQEGRYERDELSIPSDFKFKDRFTLFRDSDIVALICPRALEIQAGSKDDDDHREPGKAQAPLSEAYYTKLGLRDRFHYLIFEGGHEFHDESAWDFVKKHL